MFSRFPDGRATPRERYEALADELDDRGVFADAEWRRIFLTVPRWEFLPAHTWAPRRSCPPGTRRA